MKRNHTVVLFLLVVLVLSACKPVKQLPVNTIIPNITTDDQTVPVTGMDSTSEETQLHFYIDNNETIADATLFSGDGYSIYILADSWAHQTGSVNGYSVDIWQNTEEQSATLMVLKMGTSDSTVAHSWLKTAFDEYDLLEDSQGGMGGTNADGHMMDSQIFFSENSTYILIKMYALENAETAGTYLTVMADTFELT